MTTCAVTQDLNRKEIEEHQADRLIRMDETLDELASRKDAILFQDFDIEHESVKAALLSEESLENLGALMLYSFDSISGIDNAIDKAKSIISLVKDWQEAMEQKFDQLELANIEKGN